MAFSFKTRNESEDNAHNIQVLRPELNISVPILRRLNISATIMLRGAWEPWMQYVLSAM